MKRMLKETDTILVCDSCLQASCVQGVFYCDYAKMAGISEKTVKELREIGTGENESYWEDQINAYNNNDLPF